MYQTPTSADFQRILVTIMQKTREGAYAEDQRIKVEYASKGLGQSGPLIGAVAVRFDELHAEMTEAVMHLIRDFVGRTQLMPKELGAAALVSLENFAAELVAGIPQLGVSLQQATEQTREKYRRTFQQRIDEAIQDVEIGFVGGRNMAVPVKDADRRAVILQRFYDERHVRSWVAFPAEASATHEERVITSNICDQLHQGGLIELRRPLQGEPGGMARITNLGVDVIEGNTKAPIAISIDRSISVSGSTLVQIGDGNTQDIRIDADKIVAAINHSSASLTEKEDANVHAK
jgi:hypothetical protein